MSDLIDDGIDPTGLTPRQAEFCRQYMIDLNATQAAIRAGYSENSARSIGPENLSKPVIVAEIARRKRDRAARTGIDADRVLAELGRLAFSDIRLSLRDEGVPVALEDLSDDVAASIQSVKVVRQRSVDDKGDNTYENVIEYKLADKRAALELLGKHLSLFGAGEPVDGDVEPVTSITYIEEDASLHDEVDADASSPE